MEIIFATANHNKLIEAQRILGEEITLLTPADLGWVEDIPETHPTLKENSIQKAQFVWEKFHRPCFADDSGLEVDALNGAPGAFSARYAGEPKSPINNVKKILKELENVPDDKRTARFRCVLTYIDSKGEMTIFEGTCEGTITRKTSGIEGFGYDPVFLPVGMSQTMAEISIAEKNLISHRGKAMEKLLCHLSKSLK